MTKHIKLLLVYMSFMGSLYANILTTNYPSYSYVFNEFDIDESYIYNDEFYNFVLKHEKNLKSFYKKSLKRGKEILPTMKGLLVGDGVSDLFIYLSMIESGFSTKAISSKKAVGLWQFMPATAKHYNLKVCNDYDERCDTSASTSAAIAYLNKLHRQFGKWYLAAMAYNCGEGCMERAIKKAGTNDLSILTDGKLKFLPKETREYIKKILLVAMIGENSTLDYAPSINEETKKIYTKVEVSGGTDLRKVASLLKMDYANLKKLNKKFKSNIIPNRKKIETIMIPMDKIFAFYLRYELSNTIKPHLISHYVELGETLESIAKRYKTSTVEIVKANQLKDEYLSLEQFLVIPVNKNVFENTLIGAYK
jgi:membrane-bound lytic murein transglycosylase D